MSGAAVMERVERIVATCVDPDADRALLTAALSDVARAESWLAARRAEIVARLGSLPDAFVEGEIADTTGCSLNAATKETGRSRTLERAESFAAALDHGDIRPGHVDALTRTANNLTPDQAAQLLADEEHLVAKAGQCSIPAFEQHLRRKAKELETERDAEARLERQRCNTRLRFWTDHSDGMWCLSGRFDPNSGRLLARQLSDTVETLFAEATPDTAPADPVEKQQHLTALALLRMLDGTAPASKRPGEPIVVVDATTALPARITNDDDATTTGYDVDGSVAPRFSNSQLAASIGPGNTDTAGPILDWGIPVELPLSVLRDVFDTADPDVVIIANGIILHAPGRLDLGRTTRLANRPQRRALRGLYSTCAVPGCSTHYDRCKLHHIIWWRNGGLTNLDNLLPVCARHHSKIHNDGWAITLGTHRELTIELPDGRIMTTGPPRRAAA